MENIILYDPAETVVRLRPLTFTRPISHLLIGINTIADKWQCLLPGNYSYLTADYLSELYPTIGTPKDSLVISANVIPDETIIDAIRKLPAGKRLVDSQSRFIASRCLDLSDTASDTVLLEGNHIVIERPYDLFLHNAEVIQSDFARLTQGKTSHPISNTCTVIGPKDKIFICEDAKAEGVTFNTTNGPIYIGVGAEVMEGSCLRGPIVICNHATVNMQTRIYGATTIGEHCKVGGEINNVVMHPYSNKAHDGFLGNAIIGSWSNLGAGCVASNLKNDYTEIKLWDYETRRFRRTGLQFCGLIMGDHSKAGINTMFNTATVVGVGVNIHGTGFPRNFVASFSEGSATTGFTDVPFSKFIAIAQRVMARRDITLSEPLLRLYQHIYEITEENK